MSFFDFCYKKEGMVIESQTKTAVCSFGRYQPPTKGHAKVLQKVYTIAKEVGGEAFIFTSQTTDGGLPGKKNKGVNPLDWETKNTFIEKLLPWVDITRDPAVKSPFHIIDWLKEKGYKRVILVVGSDRVPEFEDRWIPYTSEDFEDAQVVSAGSRDPDGAGVSAMSGTKAREAAMAGDLARFKVATGWTGAIASQLMSAIQERLPREDK